MLGARLAGFHVVGALLVAAGLGQGLLGGPFGIRQRRIAGPCHRASMIVAGIGLFARIASPEILRRLERKTTRNGANPTVRATPSMNDQVDCTAGEVCSAQEHAAC